jgi:FMN phosphatase YigB (HAD superfamily)
MKTILVDAINAFIIKGEGVFEEMHKLLEEYPNKKIILSGANDEEIIKFGLNNLPYEFFTLKHNPDKIDSAYYQTMLNHFKLEAGDVVYFEHHENAAKSARSVGIKTFYYDKVAKDLAALKVFLDKELQNQDLKH